ncbi:MAG: PKD domain-containing protein [Aureispira sp.]|nr:PKD domain-containing protein [Aureispira sp.]
MRIVILSICLLLCSEVYAQVVNRYPNIQRPSQTTATIAWRRANLSSGTLYLGTASGVWSDSMSTGSLEKKHFFDLAGLQPNTQYYYQVKSTAPNDTFVSAIEAFYTAPLPLEDKVSFLAYGDCGYNNTIQNNVSGLMRQESVDFAIVTGDVDQDNGDDYDDIFFGVYKDMLKRDCHFTCIGNHDTYADNAATYLDAFYLFSNNPANTERYYSFDWGDSKFVCLDANLDYTRGSAQHDWMLNEFRCNDKKWLFIFFHQPPWTNAWSLDYYIPFTPYFRYKGDEDMRTDLVPEFEKYGVDFVVNGHSHCYQRGELNGVQYLITGGAGASTLDNNTNSDAPNISVEIYENHYVRFDISGDTAKYVMINDNGQRRDSVIVVKPYTHYSQVSTPTNVSCYNENDGQIQLAVAGPKAPYTYLWNNGSTTANLSGLAPNTYTVLITDTVGCERTDTITITEPTQPSTQISNPTGQTLLCDGAALTLSTTGTFSSYLWSTGETTASIQVDSADTYSIVAYDSTSCPSTGDSLVITTGSSPTGSSFVATPNGLDVSFSTTEIGGSYYWSFGDADTSSSQNPSHTYTATGNYTVQLILSSECGSDTTTQTLNISNTGVENIEMTKALNLNIQPNPFKDYTILSFDNSKHETFELSISDLQGKRVRSYTNITDSSIKIKKGELSAGVYLYTLKGRALRATGKLIIQ